MEQSENNKQKGTRQISSSSPSASTSVSASPVSGFFSNLLRKMTGNDPGSSRRNRNQSIFASDLSDNSIFSENLSINEMPAANIMTRQSTLAR